MKRFVAKNLIFFLPVIGFTYVIFLSAGGYTDAHYVRFTTPKQTSLVLGTSRAGQALNPDIINKQLGRTDIFNYSFTVVHSPYGPVYLESIKKKLDPATREGLFILTVDPWSISSPEKDPNDIGLFRENYLALGKMRFVNLNPNVFYLVDFYTLPFYKLFHHAGEMLLHSNGWLEVSVPMDSISVKSRIEAKVKEYNDFHVPFFHFSEVRMKSLEQTIAFLNEYGEVYLVRLPVHPEILTLDNNLIPDFNQRMERLEVPYLDMTPESDRYRYTDGNHLYKESCEEVGAVISEWITKERQKQNDSLN